MNTSRLRRLLLAIKSLYHDTRRAFREFLALPTVIIFLFITLAVGAYLFERSAYKFTSPVYAFFEARVFADAEATSSLLGNIAGSIITVTSITITLLLLIVQQSASNLTSQVFDQFLRRRSNQFYFGFFVGVAVYTLITLATVDEPFNPVFSASLVFLFTVAALFLLLVLFYVTIYQMRPPVILGAIHGHTLTARERQRALIDRTRREAQSGAPYAHPVLSDQHGFVTNIDLDDLEAIVKRRPEVEEIILSITIGSFVAYRDQIAEVKTFQEGPPDEGYDEVRNAVRLERSRDIGVDPAYGVTQLEQIAWAVLSPSKSNLAPGLQAIYLLRDLLSRWAEAETQPSDQDKLPVVYNDDVAKSLILSLASLAVIASVSKEHQAMIAILEAFLHLYDRLPEAWQAEVDEATARLIPVLDAFLLTGPLERTVQAMATMMSRKGRPELARMLSSQLGDWRKRANLQNGA